MKKRKLFIKTVCFALGLLMCTSSLIGCTDTKKDDDMSLEDVVVTTEPDTSKTPEYTGDFAKPVDSKEDVASGNYISVVDVDSKYISKSSSLVFVNALAPQMSIGGIKHPSENKNEYYRLDVNNKSAYSSQNATLAAQTSGVTIRFRTNASYIYLKASMRNCSTNYKHFTDRGAFGFDVYTGTGTNRIYCGDDMQFMTDPSAINEKIMLPGGYQEVTVNLPLYGGVSSVQIGFPKDAKIAPPTERTYEAICFYGSSITQGGCVSRPGLSYSNIVCRMLNADNMNLGFSGSALGEQSIAKYIAASNISAFVMDYDYNNSVDGLRNTHYAFYETVRAAHPDIPIIMVSRPIYTPKETTEDIERQAIIKESYNKAVKSGDENVYYVCGGDFFGGEMPDLYSVDMVHPNDLGHYDMAKAIFAVLKPALEKAYPNAQ